MSETNAYETQWPGGYRENFGVYESQIGLSENKIEAACLNPFSKLDGIALEIGCGAGYWVDKHLLPRFANVAGVDVIRPDWTSRAPRFDYHQVPLGDYRLGFAKDNAFDFVWSFGCFCHLPFEGTESYVENAFRVLRPSANACLSFADASRRGGGGHKRGEASHTSPNWCAWSGVNEVKAMLSKAGFVNILDPFPNCKDLVLTMKKP